ncbi:MAG TPA: GNAT family N-acetyltransferase [Terracidiphilus sp.]|nr:GNAT family N-acetyltransferase [Terracidiphilus sp.]
MNNSTPSIPNSGFQPYIRVATDDDRPRLIVLVNVAFSIETFLEGTRTDDERLAGMMQKGSILIAEDSSGQLLACVYTEVRGPRGYLGQLAVDPAHQGKGLGRVMVEAAEEQLRLDGCEAVDIVVLNLRPELPPLYRRFGYVETGVEEEFRPVRRLAPGVECHGIKMSKQL